MHTESATHVRRIESDAAATLAFADQLIAAAERGVSAGVAATIPAFTAKLRAFNIAELDERAARLESLVA